MSKNTHHSHPETENAQKKDQTPYYDTLFISALKEYERIFGKQFIPTDSSNIPDFYSLTDPPTSISAILQKIDTDQSISPENSTSPLAPSYPEIINAEKTLPRNHTKPSQNIPNCGIIKLVRKKVTRLFRRKT